MVWARYEELLSGLGEWREWTWWELAAGAASILPLNDKKGRNRPLDRVVARSRAGRPGRRRSFLGRESLGRLCSGRERPDAGGAKRRPPGSRPLACNSGWARGCIGPLPDRSKTVEGNHGEAGTRDAESSCHCSCWSHPKGQVHSSRLARMIHELGPFVQVGPWRTANPERFAGNCGFGVTRAAKGWRNRPGHRVANRLRVGRECS